MNQSLTAIQRVHTQFTHLLAEIELLSDASHQNSTATEEIVSSIHDENELFEIIVEATSTLQKLNHELLILIK